jgi:hypothetical protein
MRAGLKTPLDFFALPQKIYNPLPRPLRKCRHHVENLLGPATPPRSFPPSFVPTTIMEEVMSELKRQRMEAQQIAGAEKN